MLQQVHRGIEVLEAKLYCLRVIHPEAAMRGASGSKRAVKRAPESSMKLFECQNCGQTLYFENTKCESCGAHLGYLPREATVTALRPAGGSAWYALAKRGTRYKFCANAELDVCNWLIPEQEPDQLCIACQHNRTIPNLSDPENLRRWRLIEVAKHRLFYTLLKLRLPLDAKNKNTNPLTFDFLDQSAPETRR